MGLETLGTALKRCGDNVNLGPKCPVQPPSLRDPCVQYRGQNLCEPTGSFASPPFHPLFPMDLYLLWAAPHSCSFSPHQGAVWNCCCCCWLESYLWVVVVLETVCATPRL